MTRFMRDLLAVLAEIEGWEVDVPLAVDEIREIVRPRNSTIRLSTADA